MNLVFGHRTQPLPHRDLHSSRILTFFLEVAVGKPCKDFHRFGVQSFHQREHIVLSAGELLAMLRVTANVPLNILREHESFRDRDMPQQIAQCEFTGRITPIHLVRWHTPRHPHRALPHIPKIVQKRLYRPYLHTHLTPAHYKLSHAKAAVSCLYIRVPKSSALVKAPGVGALAPTLSAWRSMGFSP